MKAEIHSSTESALPNSLVDHAHTANSLSASAAFAAAVVPETSEEANTADIESYEIITSDSLHVITETKEEIFQHENTNETSNEMNDDYIPDNNFTGEGEDEGEHNNENADNENKSEKEEEIGTNNMTDVNIITNYSTIFIVFL